MKDGTLKNSKLARKKAFDLVHLRVERHLKGMQSSYRQGYDRGFRDGAVAVARGIRDRVRELSK